MAWDKLTTYWHQQKNRQKNRKDLNGNPIQYLLTKDDISTLLAEANITIDQVGRKKHEYCLLRKNDIGNYEIGNVYFSTMLQNSLDAQQNRFHNDDFSIVRKQRDNMGPPRRKKKISPPAGFGKIGRPGKEVIVEGNLYPSRYEASRQTGMSRTTIQKRIKDPRYTDYYEVR